MTELQVNVRNHVITTLQVFASEDRQREYKDAVPFVHIPDEIIEQWCSYRELRRREWYIEIWGKSELASLDNFDLKFKKMRQDIGEDRADIPGILENQSWIEIMKSASECLRCINGDFA